ncbi:hypothetical protein [Caulobacter sp. BP25]|uniref:hypothetical protein n=1 Tax=Caulobacter sp. BP25 TaxID=2048900 RepID=UPI000C12AEF9|nr:hypothetical protein [Caulobacter sp. BP25]PHY20904.1 hypothetical protein CSW59_06750 [Caulobacter sp. BP25]
MARPAALAATEARVASALAAFETAPAVTIFTAPLVVLSADAPPRQIIGLHAGGRTVRLDTDEAILTAVALEHDATLPGAKAMAAGLRHAVAVTDLVALAARMRTLRSPTGNA